MPGILRIFSGAPVWVFPLLAVLIVLGVQALWPRKVPLWRLALAPAMFMSWGLISLGARAVTSPELLAGWGIAAAIGVILAQYAARPDRLRIDPLEGLIAVPGSPVPLVRNLSMFLTKYGLGIAFALAPGWHASIAMADIAVSGLSAGYFAASLLLLLAAYRAARQSLTLARPG